jgi:hypothetical protein
MPDYLNRYRQGECEQVWEELLALGDRIREKPLYREAHAVADETMRRARANIELLVPRLTALGYKFAHPDRVFVPADKEFRRFVADMERRAGLLPLALRTWCDVVGEVNLMGSHPKLSAYYKSPGAQEVAQNFLSLLAKHGGAQGPAAGDVLQQGLGATMGLLDEVVQRIKSGQYARSPNVAAGVRASKEVLQGFQRPTPDPGPDVESDPLVVEPYFGDLEDSQDDSEDDEGDSGSEDPGPYSVIIAPDSTHKTGQSGGEPYTIEIPNPAIDAPLDGLASSTTFVEYLRVCFRWGAFPGLRASANPPREELAYLTEGLSPL